MEATLTSAPSSTKNVEGKRDPETHQTEKGNQWCFVMWAHIGLDAYSSLMHSVEGTVVNVNDVTQAHKPSHGEDDPAQAITDKIERDKASIRAKAEHPFLVIKKQSGHVKVRYRGLEKNAAQLKTLFMLSNLWVVRGKLMAGEE